MKFDTTAEDRRFRQRMEAGEFPAAEFDHRAHLRLAYIYLAENNPDQSTELMRDTLNRFLVHNGVDPSKYHATITRAWILAVHHFMHRSGGTASADELIDAFPDMLDSKIMLTQYSADLLFSDEARAAFDAPDLEPIPRY